MISLKDWIEKSVDFIDARRKYVYIISLSILGLIILTVFIFMKNDELTVDKEVDIFIESVEQKKYSAAVNYYNEVYETFSESKKDRFNKLISKQINKILLSTGDKYINNMFTKEHFIGLINMINILENLDIESKNILVQALRVSDMYKSENIDYDKAYSYLNSISNLNVMGTELGIYKQEIKNIYDSRILYENSIKNQNDKKFYEAIQGYDKVLEEDTKYYNLAQKAKEKCIEQMYSYYIDIAMKANEEGDYEKALQYINYLKNYYIDDEKILALEKEYNDNLTLYTLSTDDIINLIVNKSKKDKDSIKITSFKQMLDGKKYYYAEVYEYDTLIDEILISAETRKIYSYRDEQKSFRTNFSDGYFRVSENRDVEFSISEGEAKFILENKLYENNEAYKSMSFIDESKVNTDKENIYYYISVNKGLFKKKEIYAINMYDKTIYSIND
jgi:hypothetical protein